MKIKLLAIMLSILPVLTYSANAQTFPENQQGVDFGVNDLKRGTLRDRLRAISGAMEEENKQPQVSNVEEIENNIQEVFVCTNGKALSKDEYENQVSAYTKALNLNFEQKNLAKKISDDSKLKKEQLLRALFLLQKQARELEAKSLRDFMDILTPEQKQIFFKLRAAEEAKRDNYDTLQERNNKTSPKEAEKSNKKTSEAESKAEK